MVVSDFPHTNERGSKITLIERLRKNDIKGEAQRCFLRNLYSNVIEILPDYVEKNPNDLDVRFYLGASYFYRNNYYEAERHLSEVVRNLNEIHENRIEDLCQQFQRNPNEKFIPCGKVKGDQYYQVFISIEDVIKASDADTLFNIAKVDTVSSASELLDGLYIDYSPNTPGGVVKEYLSAELEIERKLDNDMVSRAYNMLGLCKMEILDKIGWDTHKLNFKRAAEEFKRALIFNKSNNEALVNLAYIKLYEAREKWRQFKSTYKNIDGDKMASMITDEFNLEAHQMIEQVENDKLKWKDSVNRLLLLKEVFNSLYKNQICKTSELSKVVVEKIKERLKAYNLPQEQVSKVSFRMFQDFNVLFGKPEVSYRDVKKAIFNEYAHVHDCRRYNAYSRLEREVRRKFFQEMKNQLYEIPKNTFEEILEKRIDAELEKKLGRNDVYIVEPSNKKSRIVLKVFSLKNSSRAIREIKILEKLRMLSSDLEIPYGEIKVPDAWLILYTPNRKRKEGCALLAVQRIAVDSMYEKFAKLNTVPGEVDDKLESLELAVDGSSIVQCILSDEFPQRGKLAKDHYIRRFYEKVVNQHIKYRHLNISEELGGKIDEIVDRELNKPLQGFFTLRYIDGNSKNILPQRLKDAHRLWLVDWEINRWQVAARDPVSFVEFDETEVNDYEKRYLYKRWFLNICHYFVYKRDVRIERNKQGYEMTKSGLKKVERNFNDKILGKDPISLFLKKLKYKLKVDERLEEFNRDVNEILEAGYGLDGRKKRFYLREFDKVLEKYGFEEIEEEFWREINHVSAKFHLFVSGDKLRDMKDLESQIDELEEDPEVKAYKEFCAELNSWHYALELGACKKKVKEIWARVGLDEEAQKLVDAFGNLDDMDKICAAMLEDYDIGLESMIKECYKECCTVITDFLSKCEDFKDKSIEFEGSKLVRRYIGKIEEHERVKKNYHRHVEQAVVKMRTVGMDDTLELLQRVFKFGVEDES